ncbi:hypothetical protein C8R43DRAFT_1108130 [Mycena crocata]|nr:hypothetical protein C8R43DRAFT_1108130 [Mycena crocata]
MRRNIRKIHDDEGNKSPATEQEAFKDLTGGITSERHMSEHRQLCNGRPISLQENTPTSQVWIYICDAEQLVESQITDGIVEKTGRFGMYRAQKTNLCVTVELDPKGDTPIHEWLNPGVNEDNIENPAQHQMMTRRATRSSAAMTLDPET